MSTRAPLTILLLVASLWILPGGWRRMTPTSAAFAESLPIEEAPFVGEVCFATPNNGATVYSSTNASAVQSAVDAASVNDTVKIAGTCAGVTTRAGATQTVYISQTLTLAGGYTITNWLTSDPDTYPTVLNAQTSGRVINATKSLTVTNLTVQNGRTTSYNGAGAIVTGTLTLSNTKFFSNTNTAGQGGGAYATGLLSITNSLFYTNTSATNGGGANSDGGLSIAGGWFQNNQCTGACSGGAASSNNNTLIVTSTKFYSNTGNNNGGALHGNSALAITGAYFQGNRTTNAQGGAVAHFGGNTNAVVISNTQFYGNSAATHGGALRISGLLSVINSVLDKNTAGAQGGAIIADGGGGLTNTLLARNASVSGAVVYANGNTLALRHTTIASPTLASGTAIYVNAGAVYVTNTIIASYTVGLQQAAGALSENYNLYHNVTTPFSGAISTGANSLTGTVAFADTTYYSLTSASAAVNVGTNAGAAYDYAGDMRPQSGSYDIGYDELASRCWANNGTVYDSYDASALRNALATTASGGTVKLAGYCAGATTQSGTTQVALITKTLTLTGGYTYTNWATQDLTNNATTLDAQGGGRVLYASVTATLQGFTMTNGYLSANSLLGGGMYAANALTLTNMAVYSNALPGSFTNGGGVFIAGAALLTNTTVTSNTSTLSGGGLYVGGAVGASNTTFSNNRSQNGGGAYLNGATTGSNVTLTNNTATQSAGGAFFGNTVNLTGATFSGNTGSVFGGGAKFNSTSASVYLTSTTFTGNSSANSDGGAAFFGPTTLTNTAFTSNSAGTAHGGAGFYEVATVQSTTFTANSASTDGGGTYFLNTASLTNTAFTRNTANGFGGGAYFFGSAAVTNTTFISNTAGYGGGASVYGNTAETEQFVNVLWAANRATNTGAAVYASHQDGNDVLRLIHTTIVSPTLPTSGTQAIYLATGTAYLTNTLVASHTLGIRNNGGTVSEWNSLYSNVTTPYSGSVSVSNSLTGTAAFYDTTYYTLSASSAAIDAGTNAGIGADYFGATRPQGSGYDVGYAEPALPMQCYATLNDGASVYASPNASALRNALAAANAGSTVKFAGNCAGTVTQNGTAQVALITQTLTLAGGYTTTNWLTPDLTQNATTVDALAGGRGLNITAAASLNGFTVTNGYVANLAGAGIYAGSHVTLTRIGVYNNILTGTSTTAAGGGLSVVGIAMITGSTILSNYAYIESGGGGAFFEGVSYITNSTFANNRAETFGGGAVFYAAGNLTNTTFSGNTGVFGGGASFNFGSASLNSVTFKQNTADTGGGAYFNGSTNLTRTYFETNTAGIGGGAWLGDTATIMAAVFRGNTASSSGGGLAISGNGGAQQQLVNALFSGNSATGGVIRANNGAVVSLAHLTLVSPTTASGAGVYLFNSSLNISNTLIASHTVGLQRNVGTVTEDYNLFSNVTTPYTGTVVSGGHSLTGTAAFYDTTWYTLTAASAALNAGTNVGITEDYFGDTRPQGDGYDIGYDELPQTYTCFATPDDGMTVYSSTTASALRNALGAASAGGTVKFAGDCAGVSGGQVAAITQTLTLQGGYTTTNWTTQDLVNNPTFIDAQGGGRGLYISVTAALDGFTLTNGYLASGNGAGLYAASALTLTNVNVYSNTTTGDGGGAYIAGAAIMTNSVFQQNSGGALRSGGGAYIAGVVTLSGAQFITNTFTSLGSGNNCGSASACGGGFYAASGGTAQNVLVRGNTAGFGGGGWSGGAFTATALTVMSNTATGYSGGAYVSNSALITASTFSGNTAGGFGGGALFNNTVALTNVVFLNNTAGQGGGFAHVNTGTGRFVNLLLAGNSAATNGHAMNLAASVDTLLHLTIVSPTLVSSGAAIYFNGNTTYYLTNTIVASYTTALRRAQGTVRENYNLFSDVTTPYSGTNILSGGNSLTGTAAFYDTSGYTLTASSAAVDTGANVGVTSDYFGTTRPQGAGYDIGYAEYVTPVYVCFATPNNGTTVYSSIDASALRNAIATASAGGTVKVAGTCAGVSGGQVAAITQTLTLKGGYTTTNWIISNPVLYPTILDAQNGGRVITATAPITVENLTVQNGQVSDHPGGGLSAAEVVISNVNFYSNTSTQAAGGVYANGIVTLTGGLFQNNRAEGGNGGGLYATGLAMLTSPIFTNNFALDGGGGAYFASAATLTGTTFTANLAEGDLVVGGGGAYFSATATLTNTTFTSNTVFIGNGGGAFFMGAAWVNGGLFQRNRCIAGNCNGAGGYAQSALILVNTQFISNTAAHFGGGLYARDMVTLSGGAFQQNQASNSGGGAYFYTAATLTSTTFTSNTANVSSLHTPQGGSDSSGGGAFLNEGGTLYGVTFTGNQAAAQGGGAYFYGATTALLSGATFLTNTATNEGGGAYLGGFNDYMLTNTSFIGNVSTGGAGGGLRAYVPNNNVSGTGLYFYNNRALGGGGGAASFEATTTLSNTQVISNASSNNGGGLYFSQPVTLTVVTVASNSGSAGGGAYFISTAEVTRATFNSNTATGNGGGAHFGGATSLSSSAFTGNRTTAASGGGAAFFNTATVTQTSFVSNSASASGGGAYVSAGGFAQEFVNVLFAQNTGANGAAVGVGNAASLQLAHVTIASPTEITNPAVYVTTGTVYLTNTLVASHTYGLQRAGGTVSENYTLFSNVTTPTLGVITSGGNSLTGTAAFYNTTGYTLTASSAAIDAGMNAGVTTDYFGDPRPQGGGYDIGYDESPDIPVYTCFATPNNGVTVYSSTTAGAVRAALAMATNGTTVKVAGYCAGVTTEGGSTQVALITQTVTLAGGYTTTNWLTPSLTSHATTLDAQSSGRGLSITVAAMVQGLTITNGLIDGMGSGIYARGALTLTNVMLANNVITGSADSARRGGGAYIAGPAWVADTTAQNNTARSGGGGIYFESAALVSQTMFISNTGVQGGGAFFYGFAALTGTTFVNNAAPSADGGGATFYGTSWLTNTTFISNTANDGGGVSFITSGPATLTTVTFDRNWATGRGGGAQFHNTATISNSAFVSNTAANQGGGAYFASAPYTTSVTVANSTFNGNMATQGGGVKFSTAIFNTRAGEFVNVLFANNRASGSGSALYVDDASLLRLVHATIVSDTVSPMQALYVNAGTVYVTNTIVASHTVAFHNGGGAVIENYNLFSTVTAPYSGGVASGGNSLTGTAAFYNTNWYTLTAASAAIDAGTNAGITSDYFGNLRPQGNGYDIGYAESPYAFYVITPTAGANGAITPNSPQTVNYGSSLTFTITPNSGYAIADVRVDGVSVGAISSYAFNNITANHTISASFAAHAVTLTVTLSGTQSGVVTSAPGGINCGLTCVASFSVGTVVTLTATPEVGAAFLGWSGAGCSGTGVCVVTLHTAQSVSAAFAYRRYLPFIWR